MAVKAGIVSTVRGVEDVLESFLAYHLGIGFDHVFLFFDDPKDPSIAIADGFDRVSTRRYDESLQAEWQAHPRYAEMEPFLDYEVKSRQTLNGEIALARAREMGLDWLLHIDADELFFTPTESVEAHFDWLQRSEFDVAIYPNHEGIPERADAADYFREVTLFKRNAVTMPGGQFTPEQRAVINGMARFRDQFFLFYGNGKSAGRVARDGMSADGVHRFVVRDGHYKWAQSPKHFILHYPCCGFRHFWNKYTFRGKFPDTWWNTVDIAKQIGRFHLDSRDIVQSGDRAAAERFYKERSVLDDADAIATLMNAGVLFRAPGPAELIAKLLDARADAAAPAKGTEHAS